MIERLYAPGGPKEQVRFRRDYAEKRCIAWEALVRWSRAQRSGRWGTTFAQLIASMHGEMAALEAKPWQAPPAFAELAPEKRRLARHEWLVWHYAPFVRSMLEDFRQVGLLDFQGEQDNNGFWFRLVVELHDPPRGQPARPQPQPASAPSPAARRPEGGRGRTTGECPGDQRQEASDRTHRRAAPGAAPDPLAVNSDSPLRDAGYAGSTTLLLESQPLYETSLSRPGAQRANNQSDDVAPTTHVDPGSAKEQKNRASQDPGADFAARVAAIAQRVAAHEAAMAEPRQRARAARAGQAERALAELRQLEVGARPPLWLYTRAFEALRGQPAKFASARHGVRLARVLDRYERYRDCRPQGWPAAAAAALVRTIEQGAHTIRGEPIESLAGYLHQLDRLTRHMRRAYKREHAERYHEAARRRARRRRRRRAASTFRRPLPPIELATLHDAYLAAGDDDIRVLELLGRLATREQLRRELRERYLISRRTTGGYGGFSRGDTSAAGRGRREQAPPALANRQVQPSNEAGQTAARRRGPNRGEVVLRAGAARPGTARVGPVPGEDRHARPRPRSRAR